MNKIITLLFVLLAISANAQIKKHVKLSKSKQAKVKVVLKEFKVLENGDTINKLYSNNLKHGNWIEKIPAALGEDEGQNIGLYNNGIKEGKWSNYINGIISEVENYKHGIKDGEYRYYEDGNLAIKGNYKLTNIPKKDTINVATPFEYDSVVVVTNDKISVKDGIWVYYKPNGKVDKKEYYYMDELVQVATEGVDDASSVNSPTAKKGKTNTLAPTADPFAKKNKGKAPSRYTDLPEDGKGVKPNVRVKKK
jgi:antitoxin component YwqK of YwqJK toxin-antitoxin module